MASLIYQLAKLSIGQGELMHHRTVKNNMGRKFHIYFSQDTFARFVLTEDHDHKGKGTRVFTELRQLPNGRSLLSIEGELLRS